jgi:hypothetical protein
VRKKQSQFSKTTFNKGKRIFATPPTEATVSGLTRLSFQSCPPPGICKTR